MSSCPDEQKEEVHIKLYVLFIQYYCNITSSPLQNILHPEVKKIETNIS